jgi:hypothetical protein
MFGFNSTEFADRKPAAGMTLQVFDMSSGTCAGFFQGLHRSVAVFAPHDLVSFNEGFVESAGQPTATYFDLALRHHREFPLSDHL